MWASSVGIGFILFFFTAMQALGAHLLGADTSFMAARPDMVNDVLSAGLGGKDLMESAGKQGMIVPQLIGLMGDAAPWLVATRLSSIRNVFALTSRSSHRSASTSLRRSP